MGRIGRTSLAVSGAAVAVAAGSGRSANAAARPDPCLQRLQVRARPGRGPVGERGRPRAEPGDRRVRPRGSSTSSPSTWTSCPAPARSSRRPRPLLQGHRLRLDARRSRVGHEPAAGRDDLPRRPLRHGAHLRDDRADLMFGAGYATAEERLFLMDAIRRTAKGTLAGLTGAGAASDDAAQLTDQDFSDEELTAQFDSLPRALRRRRRAGARRHPRLHRRHQRAHRRGQLEPPRATRGVRGAGRQAGAAGRCRTPPRWRSCS